jgi:hypothetical protein
LLGLCLAAVYPTFVLLRFKARHVTAALFLLCISGGLIILWDARPNSLADDEWAICEAVCRQEFNRNIARNQFATAIYLQVGGKNPPAEFLSCCRTNCPVLPAWRFTLHRGVLFEIGRVRIEADAASIDVHWSFDPRYQCSEASRYRLIRTQGGWQVEKREAMELNLFASLSVPWKRP